MSERLHKKTPRLIHGRVFVLVTVVLALHSTFACAEPLTLPLSQRPEWLGRDGIVMAGSWEPLPFRVRRDGSDGYTPTAEQQAAYMKEHSAEMVAELKALGVNFVMMHCYKGAGLAWFSGGVSRYRTRVCQLSS